MLSGSALGGLRWSLTQLLLKNKKLGMDNPVATIYWLAPIMGVLLLIVSAIVDRLSDLIDSRFFDSLGSTVKTCFFLTAPGFLAFCMILSEVTYVFPKLYIVDSISLFKLYQYHSTGRCGSYVYCWNCKRSVNDYNLGLVFWRRVDATEHHRSRHHYMW